MRRLGVFIATFGYIGYVPFAPGTFGSAAGLVVFFLIVPFCLMSYHYYKAFFPKAVQRAHKT